MIGGSLAAAGAGGGEEGRSQIGTRWQMENHHQMEAGCTSALEN